MKKINCILISLILILSNVNSVKAQSKYQPVDTKGQLIKRFDFTLFGTTCVVCYFKINDMLNKTPGVYKCAIMLEKPHAGVCVYNPMKIFQYL